MLESGITPTDISASENEWPGTEVIPEGDRFYLWGIDGDLLGNEERMHSTLPFFVRADDPRIFAARRSDWSFASLAGLTIFHSAEQATDAGTPLTLKRRVAVRPGQLVVLLGPIFCRNLFSFADSLLQSSLGEMSVTPEEFRVACLEVDNYESFARLISFIAKEAFDREVRAELGKKITAKAEAALSVLRNTGYTPVHDQVIRALLAAKVQRKPDTYRKSLKMASLRLRQPAASLEQDVYRHLKVLCPPTFSIDLLQAAPSEQLGEEFGRILSQMEKDIKILRRFYNRATKSPKSRGSDTSDTP